MAFPCLTCTPDIVDQFVVIKGEVAGDIPVPFCKFDTTAQVQLVVLPDTNHRWHDLDWQWQRGETHGKSPRLNWMRTQFFVEPVTIHDVKVDFIGPVAVQVFVRGGTMATTMHGILVCAGTNLETEVEEAFGVVKVVF